MKPVTPLPWVVSDNPRYVINDDNESACLADENAAYIAHAANAYPRLVAALHEIIGSGEASRHAKVGEAAFLLRELGEI